MPDKLTHVLTSRAIQMARDMGLPVFVKPLNPEGARLYHGTQHMAQIVEYNVAASALSDSHNATVWVDSAVVDAMEAALALAD